MSPISPNSWGKNTAFYQYPFPKRIPHSSRSSQSGAFPPLPSKQSYCHCFISRQHGFNAKISIFTTMGRSSRCKNCHFPCLTSHTDRPDEIASSRPITSERAPSKLNSQLGIEFSKFDFPNPSGGTEFIWEKVRTRTFEKTSSNKHWTTPHRLF